MTYAQRHLDPAQAAAYGRKHSRTWLRRLSHWREMRCVRAAVTAALATLQPRVPHPVILDLPCGAGRLAPWLAGIASQYLPGDHSPHMLELTKGELARHGLGERAPRYLQTDARQIPLEDASVDLVVCLRLVHHFPDRADLAAILGELARISKGPVVVSFLDADSWKQRRKRRRAASGGSPGNRAAITRADLAEVARAHGLALAKEWKLSSLFSGLSIALLTRRPAR